MGGIKRHQLRGGGSLILSVLFANNWCIERHQSGGGGVSRVLSTLFANSQWLVRGQRTVNMSARHVALT